MDFSFNLILNIFINHVLNKFSNMSILVKIWARNQEWPKILGKIKFILFF